MTIFKAMNRGKSENSKSSSHLPGSAAIGNREKALTEKLTTYESVSFSRPVIDSLNGILPDFNRRLSSERDLGLSPLGHSRLGSATHPRLVSDSCTGLSTSEFPETLSRTPEIAVEKGLQLKPDLAGRTLAGAKICSVPLKVDLPLAPLRSRFVALGHTREDFKEAEKGKK